MRLSKNAKTENARASDRINHEDVDLRGWSGPLPESEMRPRSGRLRMRSAVTAVLTRIRLIA